MKTISLKIDDLIFGETENIVALIKKPRNRYINETIEYYNKENILIVLDIEKPYQSQLFGLTGEYVIQ